MTDWTQPPPPRTLGGRLRARGAEQMLEAEMDAARQRDAETPTRPPWEDGCAPDPDRYLESECFVAGALSTMEPFRHYHPAWCLPFARQALDAISEWEPNE